MLLLSVAVLVFSEDIPPLESPKLVYATYAAQGRGSGLGAVAVDSDGFLYTGGSGLGPGGASCAFLSKLNQQGTGAIWTICLPGTEVDGLAVDSQGFLYVAAVTPATVNSDQRSFLIKLAPDGQMIVYTKPIPGAAIRAIALDASGSVYAAGLASSGFQSTTGLAAGKTFALRVDPAGNLNYATRLDLMVTKGIATDSTGSAWIAGYSCYNATGDANLSCDTTKTGTASAIRKLDAIDGRLQIAKTFGGGPQTFQNGFSDSTFGLTSGSGDSVWVVGTGHSPAVPTTSNGMITTLPGGARTGYLIQVAATGEVIYGSYLASTSPSAVTADRLGNPYLVSDKGFLALTSDGSRVLASDENDRALVGARALLLDDHGGLYALNGSCVTTPGAYEPFPGGTGCVIKLDLTQESTGRILQQESLASHLPGDLPNQTIAPGEMLLIKGRNLPANPVISFSGVLAPVVASDSATITAVVPFALSASWTSLLVEGVDGGLNLLTSSYAPGLFSADGSGRGQLDAYHSDGSANSPSNPAEAGSVVSVFLTGAGAMVPAIADGSLGPVEPPYSVPIAPVYILVNGVPGAIVFVGQAAGKIAGIVRVDFRVPVETATGDAIVRVGVGTTPILNTVQPMTTVAVR